jgi:hypothetical protein
MCSGSAGAWGICTTLPSTAARPARRKIALHKTPSPSGLGLITVWLPVRVLPAPPRSPALIPNSLSPRNTLDFPRLGAGVMARSRLTRRWIARRTSRQIAHASSDQSAARSIFSQSHARVEEGSHHRDRCARGIGTGGSCKAKNRCTAPVVISTRASPLGRYSHPKNRFRRPATSKMVGGDRFRLPSVY